MSHKGYNGGDPGFKPDITRWCEYNLAGGYLSADNTSSVKEADCSDEFTLIWLLVGCYFAYGHTTLNTVKLV